MHYYNNNFMVLLVYPLVQGTVRLTIIDYKVLVRATDAGVLVRQYFFASPLMKTVPGEPEMFTSLGLKS